MLKEIFVCIAISIAIFLVVSFSLWYFIPCEMTKNGTIMSSNMSIVNAYHSSIRGYIFSGFLSIGAFMFSLMTFVITNLKEKLFDTDRYLKDYARNLSRVAKKEINPEQVMKKDLYAPLMQLTSFICIAICMSILTSILQFTIGFSGNIFWVGFCGYSGILTLCFFIKSLYFLWTNLKGWLDTEETARLKEK